MLEKMGFLPDPGNTGWYFAVNKTNTGFFGDVYPDMQCRIESERKVRLRVHPAQKHCNQYHIIHGGFILALVDSALFVGPAALGIAGVLGGVTMDASTQFFGAMKAGAPIDIVLEIMQETGRMVFSRGVFEQNGEVAAGFSGITKKASSKPA